MQTKDAAEFSGNDGWSPWSCYVYEDVDIAALAERSPEDPEEQRTLLRSIEVLDWDFHFCFEMAFPEGR